MTTCRLGNRISAGSFGTVYESDNDSVTKVFDFDPRGVPIESTAEIDILFRLKSPFIVKGTKIYASGECGSGKGFALGLERLTGSSITLAKSNTYVNPEIIKKIMLHYALGLECLHKYKYLHLDITSNNALYGGSVKDPVGKLIDFGLSSATELDELGRLKPIITKQLRITPTYRPLENLYLSQEYSDKSDVWSLGILFLELLSKKSIYDDSNPEDKKNRVDKPQDPGVLDWNLTMRKQLEALLSNIEKNLEKLFQPVHFSDKMAAVKLVAKMLDRNVNSRLTSKQVANDSYFDDVRGEVTNQFKNVCSQNIVMPLAPTTPFTDLRYKGLQYLITIISNDWSFAPAELLFLSLDVYMRTVAGVGLNATDEEYTNIALGSLIVSANLFYLQTDWPVQYRGAAGLKLMEPIVKLLGGIIRRPYLYDTITISSNNGQELLYIYKDIFTTANYEVLDSYLRINLNSYIKAVREKIKSLETLPRFQNIKSFLNLNPITAFPKPSTTTKSILSAKSKPYVPISTTRLQPQIPSIPGLSPNWKPVNTKPVERKPFISLSLSPAIPLPNKTSGPNNLIQRFVAPSLLNEEKSPGIVNPYLEQYRYLIDKLQAEDFSQLSVEFFFLAIDLYMQLIEHRLDRKIEFPLLYAQIGIYGAFTKLYKDKEFLLHTLSGVTRNIKEIAFKQLSSLPTDRRYANPFYKTATYGQELLTFWSEYLDPSSNRDIINQYFNIPENAVLKYTNIIQNKRSKQISIKEFFEL